MQHACLGTLQFFLQSHAAKNKMQRTTPPLSHRLNFCVFDKTMQAKLATRNYFTEFDIETHIETQLNIGFRSTRVDKGS